MIYDNSPVVALGADFCDLCFDAWYERITEWLKNREGV
jgi:hypothetical protein